jgi:2-methylisocitrate lyase-like PEP mutase family enzyme
MVKMNSTEKLRQLLMEPGLMQIPTCHDALSAKLIERAGFSAAFMGGFAVSASRLGMPDTGLISYAEMVDQGQNICNSVSIPVLGDGDTGYGNALNVKRTVKGYARAGFACIMIEDQVSPKRCGHTKGKQTVPREEAFMRLQAALDAKDEGADILIMARTDANGTDGFDEALFRAKTFAEMGADITFLEAPRDKNEMRTYCHEVPGPKMANMLEQGVTPVLHPAELQEMGYKIAAYPLSLMLAAIHAMEQTLHQLRNDKTQIGKASFEHIRNIVGFPEYYDAEEKYRID